MPMEVHMYVTRAPLITLLTFTALGCASDASELNPFATQTGNDDTGNDDTNNDDTNNDDTNSDDSSSASTGDGDSDASGGGDTDGGTLFDLGAGEGRADDSGGDEGCDSVDFLFVIDNSGSMAFYQQYLISSFPTFIEGITGTLDAVNSYHVGVVTTDNYAFNGLGCHARGALVTKTGGADSSDSTCGPYTAGGNYMSDEDDLASAFSCAAQVGTDGFDGEQPIAAMLETVSQDLQGPGDCNEGFIRDDSLLVVVIITDEPDGPGDCEEVGGPPYVSPGSPDDWYDDLVAMREGVESNIVVLTLTTWPAGGCDGWGFCETDELKVFTEMFTHGLVGGICEDYDTYFDAAVGVVDEACEAYVPVG